MKYAVLSLSGGMDSSSVLLRLLREGYHVTALAFDYGQKHRIELEQAQALCELLQSKKLAVTFQQIQLSGLMELLHSNLVEGGAEVPKGHYQEETMKQTYVPNRNKIFSSIVQAVALSIANQHDTTVKIALGIHAGDHTIYPDCRQSFRDKDYAAFLEGNWDAEVVQYYTPYLDDDKTDVLRDGIQSCQQLHLDVDAVYSRTHTSYEPLQIDGRWYSDYQSSSSIERIEAFMNLNLTDPLQYADESGLQSWQTVCEHVRSVLANQKAGLK